MLGGENTLFVIEKKKQEEKRKEEQEEEKEDPEPESLNRHALRKKAFSRATKPPPLRRSMVLLPLHASHKGE